jgi:hypothetical protein
LGKFSKLEEQMCAMAQDGYTGKGSPDRLDAMVHGLTELLGGGASVQMFPDFRPKHRQSDPANAVHVYAEAPLKDWWPRHVSAVHGYSSAAHWWVREPNGRVRVYRELIAQDVTPEEFGRMIAERSKQESAATKILPVWLAESAFAKSGQKCVAAAIAEGIQRAVGEHKAFLFVYTEEERSLPDAGKRWDAINARLNRMPKGFLSVQALTGKESNGWDIVREMLRWRPGNPQAASSEPDWNYARELALKDYPQYEKYVAKFRAPEPEVLPKLMIAAECPGMIQAMSGATRSQDDDAVSVGGGGFVLQSLRIGCLASREEQGREPMEEFIGKRLDMLPEQASGTSRYIAAQKAEHDYQNRFGAGPISFARRRR